MAGRAAPLYRGACPPGGSWLHRHRAAWPALFGATHRLGPRRGVPGVVLGFVKRLGDQHRFLLALAEVCEQLGDGEDIVQDAEAIINQLRNHGRAPVGLLGGLPCGACNNKRRGPMERSLRVHA